MPLFSRRTRALCFSLSRSRAAVNLKSINFTAAAAFFARNVQINYTRELKHKIERRGDKKTGGAALIIRLHANLETREREMKKRRLSALVNFDVVHILLLLTPASLPNTLFSFAHQSSCERQRAEH
jgi:hypothetical protein